MPFSKLYSLYFAESGRLSGVYSELRKVFGREPEPLLEITHDVMGDPRVSWQAAAEQLGVPVEAYFRDQIPERLLDFVNVNHIKLPAVVGLNRTGENQLVCSREDIVACQGKPEMLAEKLRQQLAS